MTQDLKTMLTLEHILDLYGIIEGMTDAERIACAIACAQHLDTEGSIQKIRDEINDPRYDD